MPRTHRPFWPGVALVIISAATFAYGLANLPGCASNPVTAAQDSEQRAYAIYGTFVIVEEQAAKLVGSSQVPNPVVTAIKLADARAKPSADALVQAVRDYDAAVLAVKHGTVSANASVLSVASANLNQQVSQAQTDVAALVNAVKQGS